MNLYLKKLKNIFYVFNIKELLIILYYYPLKKLHTRNIKINNLFIFINQLSDHNLDIRLFDKHILKVKLGENHSILLRKFTRDINVFNQIFLNDEYKPLIDLIPNKNNLTILDIGSNIGLASIYFSIHLPNCKIIAIEPEESNLKIAERNFKINNFSENISIVKKAIWNENTTLKLQIRDDSHDSFHVMERNNPDNTIIGTIKTITFNEVINDFNLSKIDILKIDIEGAEKILFQDKVCLEQFLPICSSIAIEVHEEYISESEIQSILEEYNFRVIKNSEYLIGIKKQ